MCLLLWLVTLKLMCDVFGRAGTVQVLDGIQIPLVPEAGPARAAAHWGSQ